MNEIQSRLQGLWRQYPARVSTLSRMTTLRPNSVAPGRRRRPSPRRIFPFQSQQQKYQSSGLEIARFTLLSIATLPFTSWIALFSYDYYYRVHLCRESLTQKDEDLELLPSSLSTNDTSESSVSNSNLVGWEAQFDEVRSILKTPPHQILVVAGPNESGKSHFVSSMLRTIDPQRQGVTYIQSAQIVDSISTLTQAFVRAFHLQWLQLRYALVDVLPFAGSEIMVMKERYSDRDLAQALDVITEALKENMRQKQKNSKEVLLPVIVIDGLGEGSAWFRSTEGREALQQIMKWCITITKELPLAHIILTGNEELVISLTDQNRMTRGHVNVIGLPTLETSRASSIVWQEWPDANFSEIQKLTDTFGGFVHDLRATGRQIQQKLCLATEEGGNAVDKERRAQIIDKVLSARFRVQVERVTAAFARGKDESTVDDHSIEENNTESNDELDPYLDPLKDVYSETHAKKCDSNSDQECIARRKGASWSQLQLWRTLQRLVDSSTSLASSNGMAVPFGDLRDEIFEGDIAPLLELMNEDILGFEIGDSMEIHKDAITDSMNLSEEWSWQVKPATPALGRVFQYLVQNSHLKKRFQQIESVVKRRDMLALNDRERRQLRLERWRLNMRKESLLKTANLGNALELDKEYASQKMDQVFKSIVDEELAMERRGLELRAERARLLQDAASSMLNSESKAEGQNAVDSDNDYATKMELSIPPREVPDHASIQQYLKAAILDTCEQEGHRVLNLRGSFQKHATGLDADGVSAADVVRLIKENTGEEIDLDVAESFIRAWDLNNDEHLDYDEFIEMLLADVNMQKRRRKRKKKTKVGKPSSSASQVDGRKSTSQEKENESTFSQEGAD